MWLLKCLITRIDIVAMLLLAVLSFTLLVPPVSYATVVLDNHCLTSNTGLPKPIYLTVAGLNTAQTQSLLPPEDGFGQVAAQFQADGKPMLAAAPFFHAMGIIAGLRSIMCRSPLIRLPSEKMLTADLIIDVIEDIKPNSGIFPPSILEDISTTDRGIQALGKLECVYFGGAPLAKLRIWLLSLVVRRLS